MTCGKLSDREPDLDDWRPIPEEPRRWQSVLVWAVVLILAVLCGAGLAALIGGFS